jgi:hypothetical protein
MMGFAFVHVAMIAAFFKREWALVFFLFARRT